MCSTPLKFDGVVSSLLDLEQSTYADLLHSCGKLDLEQSTYADLLHSCGKLGALDAGRRIHRYSIQQETVSNRYVANLIINMYGKCGAVKDARQVLESLEEANVFSWTIMIAAYARVGHLDEGYECFCRMELEGVRANRVTIVNVLCCCRRSSQAQWFHARIKQGGYLPGDVVIQNSLVSLYGRCREVELAESVFSEISGKDVVSWTSMVSAFVQNGFPVKAMVCFWSMHGEGIRPCRVTLATILGAVMETKNLCSCEVENDDKLVNLLVRSYGKCGDMVKMGETFEKLGEKNVVSWSGTIAAFAQNGYPEEAIEQLRRMDLEGVKANEQQDRSRLLLRSLHRKRLRLSSCSGHRAHQLVWQAWKTGRR